MDIFELFTTTSYTFLQLASKVSGNVIVEEFPAVGIVKLRDNMLQADGTENLTSSTTVHIKPNEAFITEVGGDMVGHGIRIAKGNHTAEEYRIIDQVEGFDFSGNQLEFYKVTLKRESEVTWPLDSPLE